MKEEGAHGSPYLLIWIYLVVLALASVAASLVLPKAAAELTIYLLAVVKAILVALYFMHLKVERFFIHSLTLIPLALVLVLFLGLIPDIVVGR
ncbi:MAG: cytochrome C oxidase subunit IV family protein [Candidatus Tectomicrobia bacterium]|uniref:Cytochrome C oxidase subunit IV family protein n=1 Tax=Tectimicrobiota bacterium TaxID=2528274 RepID=A0A932HVP8_UNCTE|nr:cytochrome C oxidase subunit IV family protein [Candidatus Tectomicrobia bacterium]